MCLKFTELVRGGAGFLKMTPYTVFLTCRFISVLGQAIILFIINLNISPSIDYIRNCRELSLTKTVIHST